MREAYGKYPPRIYFGEGNIWINREIKGFDIFIKGGFDLDSYNPENFIIIKKGNRIIGASLGKSINETPFLKYVGDLVVVRGLYLSSDNEVIAATPKREYEDKFNTILANVDSVNEKFEILNKGADYGYGLNSPRKKLKARSHWTLNNLHTEGGEYFLGNKDYVGYFHIHQDLTAMTGNEHSKESKLLSLNRDVEGALITKKLLSKTTNKILTPRTPARVKSTTRGYSGGGSGGGGY